MIALTAAHVYLNMILTIIIIILIIKLMTNMLMPYVVIMVEKIIKQKKKNIDKCVRWNEKVVTLQQYWKRKRIFMFLNTDTNFTILKVRDDNCKI